MPCNDSFFLDKSVCFILEVTNSMHGFVGARMNKLGLTWPVICRSGKGKDQENGSLSRVMGSLYNLNHQFYGRYGLLLAQQKRGGHCAGNSPFQSEIRIYSFTYDLAIWKLSSQNLVQICLHCNLLSGLPILGFYLMLLVLKFCWSFKIRLKFRIAISSIGKSTRQSDNQIVIVCTAALFISLTRLKQLRI